MTKQKFRMYPPPEACNDCGQLLVQDSIGHTDGFVTRYCPHNNTGIVAVCGLIDDDPAIVRWIFEGPLTADEFVTAMGNLAETHKTKAVPIMNTSSLQ